MGEHFSFSTARRSFVHFEIKASTMVLSACFEMALKENDKPLAASIYKCLRATE